MILVITAGIAMYRISQSPEAQKIWDVTKQGINAQREAMTAPGTEALREAGCQQAMVMDIGHIQDIIESLEDNPDASDADEISPDASPPKVVICQTRSDNFTCEQVAQIYLNAVGQPSGPFISQVQITGFSGSKAKCNDLYGADGAFIESVQD